MRQGLSLETAGQFAKYSALGIVTNVLAYLAFIVSTGAGAEPKVAMSVIYVIVFVISFLGNRHWAFSHRGSIPSSAIRFVFTHIGGYSINLVSLYVFVDRLGYGHALVQLLTMAFLVLYFFIMLKLFVFHDAGAQA